MSVGVVISEVLDNSIAASLGLKGGDILLKINNNLITDPLDYQFFAAEEHLRLDVLQKSTGKKAAFDIKKGNPYEDLGLRVSSEHLNNTRQCSNRCIFCFIDQMPPGFRNSLYVKDDDYRHSFLNGNFITLTNLPKNTIQKIIKLRLSPLYVSVHTTNPELRTFMMGNKAAAKIMEQLKQLSRGGIDFHAQIVLCPGINDGSELERTVKDLVFLRPHLRSIGIVPVGLTTFRKGLCELNSFTVERTNEVIKQIQALQKQFLKLYGSRIVFLADEFYLKTGNRVPGSETYEGFPQLENGIGLVRVFVDDFKRVLRKLPAAENLESQKKIAIVTGVSAAPVIEQLVFLLKERVSQLKAEVVPVTNCSFGPTVTVAGLLTGSDLLRELPEKVQQDTLIFLPQVMLRSEDQVFLDNISVQQLARAINREIRVIPSDAESLIKGLLNPANNMGVM